MNKVLLAGRLAGEPQEIANGKATGLFIEVMERRKNMDSGQWEERPCKFKVTVWGAAAAKAATWHTGDPVAVDGRLGNRKNGEGWALEVSAFEVNKLAGPASPPARKAAPPPPPPSDDEVPF